MWRAFFSQPDLLTNVFPHSNRIRLTDPAPGEFYPQVRAYHMDDTRIPVRYVGLDKKTNHYSVALEENGPHITWTPNEEGKPAWQLTPDHDDGFEVDDIHTTPISDSPTPTVETYPATEEAQWSDAILVFPDGSGIAPIYLVFNKPSGDLKYIPAPKGSPPLPAFPDAVKAKKKTAVKGGGKLRERWKDKKGRIYEWDSQHGKVEVYIKNGKHLGEFDHITGEQTKVADPSREVEK
ncbi:colicin E3/pyocin S6 family cytotoxin [Photobacterium halotolerans]|uniref:colicin E3/pyocin S6 family cytotoxin n=1 Tax=Photobacterium halotolerans TaxID=265726 RepID=UPI00069657D7|nr:colicin E3/pyocin S6 family cytotoxin [Photobacterium halotolerans]